MKKIKNLTFVEKEKIAFYFSGNPLNLPAQ